MDTFVPGGMAKLLSGGPVMTIELVENDDVECVWFDNNNSLHRGRFKETSLKKHESLEVGFD